LRPIHSQIVELQQCSLFYQIECCTASPNAWIVRHIVCHLHIGVFGWKLNSQIVWYMYWILWNSLYILFSCWYDVSECSWCHIIIWTWFAHISSAIFGHSGQKIGIIRFVVICALPINPPRIVHGKECDLQILADICYRFIGGISIVYADHPISFISCIKLFLHVSHHVSHAVSIVNISCFNYRFYCCLNVCSYRASFNYFLGCLCWTNLDGD
jgi:hypothetical protein